MSPITAACSTQKFGVTNFVAKIAILHPVAPTSGQKELFCTHTCLPIITKDTNMVVIISDSRYAL